MARSREEIGSDAERVDPLRLQRRFCATAPTSSTDDQWRSDRAALCEDEEEGCLKGTWHEKPPHGGVHLTVAEARAILFADEGLATTFEARRASGHIFGYENGEAWQRLVDSATRRVAEWERGNTP